MLKFSLYYFLFAIGIAIVALAIPTLITNIVIIAPAFWLMFGFIGGITYIAYYLVVLGMKSSPETGVMAIMASIGVKMFFALGFVLIYSVKHGGLDILFILNFFSLYLLFTLFEISALLRNLRHQNK